MYFNEVMDAQDARLYLAAATGALEDVKSDAIAFSLIGVGARNGISLVQTVSSLGGLMMGRAGLPRLNTADEARKMLAALAIWRERLQALEHWNSTAIWSATGAHGQSEFDLCSTALLQSAGRFEAGLFDVSEIFLVLGKDRCLLWLAQVDKTMRNASLIG